jgi:hypothetical protein
VLAGYLRWTDYRSKEWPDAIRIEHHKTGELVWHPLEDTDGTKFYEEAERVLDQLPRRGVPMILERRRDGTAELFKPNHGQAGADTRRRWLPATFTLDSCRHGGMTELEEAELTTGQGRVHRTDRAYRGYAKLTMERALAATRKRHAHLLAKRAGNEVSECGPEIVSE